MTNYSKTIWNFKCDSFYKKISIYIKVQGWHADILLAAESKDVAYLQSLELNVFRLV